MREVKSISQSTPDSVKASFWFVVCSVLQKAIAFLTTPIFTRLMSVTQFGQVTVYNSWVEVFLVFTTLDVFYGVYNNALTKNIEDQERITSSMLGMCTTLTSLMFVVYLVFKRQIEMLTGMTTNMVLLMFVEILFLPAFYFWSAKERYHYRYKKLVCITLGMATLSPLIGVPAVLFFEEKGYARIITAVLSQVLFSIVLYITIFREGKQFFNKDYWKYALSFNLPLIPHYLSSTILNQSDRIMIDRMCGTDKAGVYGLAYTIGIMAIMFNTAIMNSFTPFTYQHLKREDYNSIRKNSNYLIVIIAIVSVLILTIAPEIIYLLGGEQYKEGVWIIAPIAASIFFRFLYSLFANIEFYYEENIFVMVASICCAIFNVFLNYLFIKKFGYLAAGYTTLACYMIYAFAHFFFSKLVLKRHVNKTALYDNAKILLMSLLVVIASALIMLLFSYPLIRIGLVLAFLTFVFANRSKIKEIITGIKT